MSLKKKPVTGMKDVSTREMEIRDYLIDIIKDTYRSYGFTSIETPIMEHIENLSSNQGGDNEKLIFKILKRGEKLKLEDASSEIDLVDSGLRYDLTLPLSRYYANNEQDLQKPFKSLQIGSVFRAERPQKGRFRQFTQCDIDIIGDESFLAEIELISATSATLQKICPNNKFTIRINDRRILKAMSIYAGINDDDLPKTLIILDKLDKIGIDGIKKELLELGLSNQSIDKYLELININMDDPIYVLEALYEKIKNHIDEDVIINLKNIISSVKEINDNLDIVYDITLVRGMGYYTGTIFEVSMDGLSSSVAGGGRYDKMIGKFSNTDVCACGFSIGFERIVTILMDMNFTPQKNKKTAFLFDKKLELDKIIRLMKDADNKRKDGNIVLVAKLNKNKKFQKDKLYNDGFEEIIEIYND